MQGGGGETAANPSGWNVDTLHRHIADLIANEAQRMDQRWHDSDRRYQQEFEGIAAAVRERAFQQDQALAAALAASSKLIEETKEWHAQRFFALERATELAFSRIEKETTERLIHVREETKAALGAADKAITKSEVSNERRFESVNEFRAQLADQAGTFIPRKEAENRVDQVAEKVADLERRFTTDLASANSRLDLTAGRSTGMNAGWGYLVGAVGAMGGMIGIVVALTQ